jgi:hypothetical protein
MVIHRENGCSFDDWQGRRNFTNSSCQLNDKSAMSFGLKDRLKETLCPKKQQNTIATRHIIWNTLPGIIMKRRGITKLVTIAPRLTMLTPPKATITMQPTMQRKPPRVTQNTTGS